MMRYESFVFLEPIQEKQRKAVNSQTKSAPLPKGWEMAFTTSGERYFIK